MTESLMCSMPPFSDRLRCESGEEAGRAEPLVCSDDAAPGLSHAPATELERAPGAESAGAAPPLLPSIVRAAVSCSGKFESVALALLQAQAGPLSALVGGVKAGYELGRCMATARNAELQLQAELDAVRECEARGGTPAELTQHTLTCVVPKASSDPA